MILSLASWEPPEGLWQPGSPVILRIGQIKEMSPRCLASSTHSPKLFLASQIGPWLDTPNPAFEGSTPLQAIERGESDRLWRMIWELRIGNSATENDVVGTGGCSSHQKKVNSVSCGNLQKLDRQILESANYSDEARAAKSFPIGKESFKSRGFRSYPLFCRQQSPASWTKSTVPLKWALLEPSGLLVRRFQEMINEPLSCKVRAQKGTRKQIVPKRIRFILR